MPAQSSDLVVVQRGATLYKATAQEIADLGGGGGGGSFAAMILQNTDTTSDLNLSAMTVVPIGGTVTSFGSGFANVSNSIRTDFTGVVRITASVYVTSTYVRPAIALEYFKNGATLGPRFNQSYIRSSSGHNESGVACPPFVTSCANGDLFDLRSQMESSSAVVTMNGAGTCFFMIERVA